MNDKRSSLPCPAIRSGDGRTAMRRDLHQQAIEKAQAQYRQNADFRSDVARKTVDAIRGGALDPPEGIGRGKVKPGGVKTR